MFYSLISFVFGILVATSSKAVVKFVKGLSVKRVSVATEGVTHSEEADPVIPMEVESKRVVKATGKRTASNVIDLAGLDAKKAYDKAWRKAKAMGLDCKAEGKACTEALKNGATTYVVGGVNAAPVEKVETPAPKAKVEKPATNVEPKAENATPKAANDDAKKAYDFGWRKGKTQGLDAEGCKASGKKAADMVRSGKTLDEVKAAFGVTPKATTKKETAMVEAPKAETPAPVEEPKVETPAAYEWKKGEKMLIVKNAIKTLNDIKDMDTAKAWDEWFNALHEDQKNYLRGNEKYQAAHKAAEVVLGDLKKTSAQKKNEEIKKAKEAAKAKATETTAAEQMTDDEKRYAFNTADGILRTLASHDMVAIQIDEVPFGTGVIDGVRVATSKTSSELMIHTNVNGKPYYQTVQQQIAMGKLRLAVLQSVARQVNVKLAGNKKSGKTA